MRSEIVRGGLFHRRAHPRPYQFVYPAACLLLDIEELERRFPSRLLSLRRFGIFSINAQDFLKGSGTVGEKLAAVEKSFTLGTAARRTVLTTPRVFGYAFNPVNFYFGEHDDGSLAWAVAEVSNTFGEKRVYPFILTPLEHGDYEARFNKDFYVSPFLPEQGEYRIQVRYTPARLTVTVRLVSAEEEIFRASIDGERRPLTDRGLLMAAWVLSRSAILTMLRIHLKAFVLALREGAPVNLHSDSKSADAWRYATSRFYPLRSFLLRIAQRKSRRHAQRPSMQDAKF